MLDAREATERSTGPAPEVGRGGQPAMAPIEPAPRVPPLDVRNEWRGTLPEALRESAARHGVTGFASADWASQSALRVTAAQDLAASVERTHARVAANEPQPKVYTVGVDGTIYNTATNRAEYVPVREGRHPAPGTGAPPSSPPALGRGELLVRDEADLKRELRIYDLVEQAKRRDGPIAVDVHVWRWTGLGIVGGRVGHVMVTEAGSKDVLLSQFPHAPGDPQTANGPNLRLSFDTTVSMEGAPGPEVYRVTVPSARSFLSAVVEERDRKTWNWAPSTADQTHCARAAYDALRLGGVPVLGGGPPTPVSNGQFLPGQLGDTLRTLSRDKGEHPWKVERVLTDAARQAPQREVNE